MKLKGSYIIIAIISVALCIFVNSTVAGEVNSDIKPLLSLRAYHLSNHENRLQVLTRLLEKYPSFEQKPQNELDYLGKSIRFFIASGVEIVVPVVFDENNSLEPVRAVLEINQSGRLSVRFIDKTEPLPDKLRITVTGAKKLIEMNLLFIKLARFETAYFGINKALREAWNPTLNGSAKNSGNGKNIGLLFEAKKQACTLNISTGRKAVSGWALAEDNGPEFVKAPPLTRREMIRLYLLLLRDLDYRYPEVVAALNIMEERKDNSKYSSTADGWNKRGNQIPRLNDFLRNRSYIYNTYFIGNITSDLLPENPSGIGLMKNGLPVKIKLSPVNGSNDVFRAEIKGISKNQVSIVSGNNLRKLAGIILGSEEVLDEIESGILIKTAEEMMREKDGKVEMNWMERAFYLDGIRRLSDFSDPKNMIKARRRAVEHLDTRGRIIP